MRAISLWQPWATLIAIGAKRIETRSWDTDFAGPLAIHAAKKCVAWHKESVIARALDDAGYWNSGQLPAGAIVAVCKLDRTATTESVRDGVCFDEIAFGNFHPGRFAWMLTDVRPLAKPINFRGRQSFFDVPDELFTEALA